MLSSESGHVLNDTKQELFVKIGDCCPAVKPPFKGVLSGEVVMNIAVN